MGDHMVVANYFAQNQAEALDPTRTVLGTLEEAAGTEMAAPDIKSLLGKMGFKGEAHDKKVDCLSGGEKARLALAKFMVTPASLLLLVRYGLQAMLFQWGLMLTRTRGVHRTSQPTTWTSRRRRCSRKRCQILRRDAVICVLVSRSSLTLFNAQGTVLAVSHDRYFLRKIATRVLELKNGVLDDYSGDYECAMRHVGALFAPV